MEGYTLKEFPNDLVSRMRQAVVSKLDPNTPSDSRQIWDLWYMPGTYCYLITHVDKIFDAQLLNEFRTARSKTISELGLPKHTECSEQIHVYVNGCFQELHNDSTVPGWSYVLYLQDQVHFTGGQTRLFTKTFPDKSKPAAGTSFFEQIEPVCGRLLVFNNNVPHMVPVVQGTMNPSLGRITLCSRLLT